MKTVLVTAGPTREYIDPVRYISNPSTGRFGYEIAAEARRRGCKVTLITGPTSTNPPKGVKLISVETAREMRQAVLANRRGADYIIMAAAICDWRARAPRNRKIKKKGGIKCLELAQNPDILKELGRKKKGVLVGFALETERLEANALKKLKEKNLDIVVANMQTGVKPPFGDNNTNIIIIDRRGVVEKYNNKPKKELAKIILDKALNFNI